MQEKFFWMVRYRFHGSVTINPGEIDGRVMVNAGMAKIAGF